MSIKEGKSTIICFYMFCFHRGGDLYLNSNVVRPLEYFFNRGVVDPDSENNRALACQSPYQQRLTRGHGCWSRRVALNRGGRSHQAGRVRTNCYLVGDEAGRLRFRFYAIRSCTRGFPLPARALKIDSRGSVMVNVPGFAIRNWQDISCVLFQKQRRPPPVGSLFLSSNLMFRHPPKAGFLIAPFCTFVPHARSDLAVRGASS